MTENNPRVVFERLFGASDSADPRVRASRLRQDRSILDAVTDRVKQLQRELGAADNRKVNDYLASLRDVERRIQLTEQQSAEEVQTWRGLRAFPTASTITRICSTTCSSWRTSRHHARHHIQCHGREQSRGPIRRSAFQSRITR